MSQTGATRPGAARGPVAGILAIVAACAAAAPLTMRSEGEVRHGYKDPVGIVTVCDGHTGAGAVLGATYTHAQCQALLQRDLLKAGEGIAPCIKVPLSTQTRAAFTDFALNVGAGAYCRSSMARLVNAGDVAGACRQLSLWTKAGGRVLPGLVTRRAAERAQCEAGLRQAPPAR
jgi:lysozyme